MKDVATPVPQQEVRAVIKKCLENAALVNYERLSQEARIEGEKRNVHKWFITTFKIPACNENVALFSNH